MPIIKSAKKQVRSSARKRTANQPRKVAYKQTVKATRSQASAENLRLAYKALDKAAKSGVIHKNKAARMKSRLSKLASRA